MSRDSVQALTAVGFPSRFFVAHTKHKRIAAQFPTRDGFALVLRNWKVSVVTLYRRTDNTVISLVILDKNGENLEAGEIVKKCLASKEHTLHPFMVSLVLSDHALEDYRKECDDAMAVSERIHSKLGLPVKHLGIEKQQRRDSLEISRTSPAKYAKLATDRESLIQLCGSLESLLDSFERLQKSFSRYEFAPKTTPKSQIEDSHKVCSAMLEYLIVTCKDMLNRMQQIETRLQWLFPMFQLQQAEADTQVTIGLAKTSAKAGVAAQRDSSSMMIIAILTTLFLPGTFVASLLDAPGYNGVWASDNPGNFWIMTAPLTALVMVLVGLWWWRTRSYNKEENKKAEDKVDEALTKAAAEDDSCEEAIELKPYGEV